MQIKLNSRVIKIVISGLLLAVCVFGGMALYKKLDPLLESARVLVRSYGWTIINEGTHMTNVHPEDVRMYWRNASSDPDRRYNLQGIQFDLSEIYVSEHFVADEYTHMDTNAYSFYLWNPDSINFPIGADIVFYDGVLGIAQINIREYSKDVYLASPWYEPDFKNPPTSWPLDVPKAEFEADMECWESYLD